jgi:hypothetical protein
MTDVLIPEKEQVIIADRKYSIGELSLKQFLQISKFLARTVLSSQKKLKELKERTAGSESNIDDIMTILDLLEEKDLYQFIGILLNENDTDFIEKNITVTKSTDIIAIICEHNKLDILKKNIQRVIQAVNPTEKKP